MDKGLPFLLSFYGDDFTGTTSMAEALTSSGVPTVVFVHPPSLPYLKRHFPKARAIGVAGLSRSLPTQKLKRTLKSNFQTMKAYRAPLFVYKVCSTFDSSPEVGSIGRAIEVGREVFSSKFVPILAAAPRFGRYTVFGHHFVAFGEDIFRLDRHPSMSCHPVTPMGESDLRRHLAKQTSLGCGLVNILSITKGKEEVRNQVQSWLKKNRPLILFDTLSTRQLNTACSVIWEYTEPGKTLFCVGSQDLGIGLGEEWNRLELLPALPKPIRRVEGRTPGPLLVVSGSCATMTGRQIEWASAHDYFEIAVTVEHLLDVMGRKKEVERIVRDAVSTLKEGRSVVIHSAIGPEDPRISKMRRRAQELGISLEKATDLLAETLGRITRRVILASGVRRAVLAGGDSSGRITKHLDVAAIQVGKSFGASAPICYTYSSHPGINGLQIAFKGGQIGEDDYFDLVRVQRLPDLGEVSLGLKSF
jgi:3-oxoisoapionate kinase